MTLPDRLLILEWPNGHLSVEESPGEDRVAYVRADAFTLTPKLPTSEADEAIVDALVQASRPKRIRTPRLTDEGFVECDLCGYESRPEKLACEFCGQDFPAPKQTFADLVAAIDADGPLPSVLASAVAYEPEKAK